MSEARLHSEIVDNAEAIAELRAEIPAEASAALKDHDCLRFLRARPGSVPKAAEMVSAWHQWRHALLEPLPPGELRFSPAIILANPHYLPNHPYIDLLPVSHCGWDKDGRPIYWEKTGTIQNNFDEVFKHFTTDELVQYHIMSQECFSLRFQYASARVGRTVMDSVVVFDMTNVNMTLNLQSVAYIKRILAVDQMYYPETLHKLFIINCPWYFTALYGLFKPFIDQRTKDKFILLRSDFLPSLLEQMDISEIPEDFGGEKNDAIWNLQNPDSTGCSMAQIEAHMREKYTEESVQRLLSPEEREALAAALAVAEDIKAGRATMWNLPRAEGDRGAGGLREGSYDADDGAGGLPALGSEADSAATAPVRYVESLSSEGDAVVTSEVDPHRQHHHAHVSLKPMRTRMVKAEDATRYHLYCLDVEYGENASWPIRRRYSDFYKFNERLKEHTKDFPNVVWPKLPPKSYLFKRSKSVVAVRLVGLDFFLSAVLDRMLRIEHDSTGEISRQGSAGAVPGAIAMRQNLRIAILEFLEVTDHVATVPDAPIHRDIIIRQLHDIGAGGAEGQQGDAGSETAGGGDGDGPPIGSAPAPEQRALSRSRLQEQPTKLSLHIIVVCIAVMSGILGYYIRMMYDNEY